MATRNRKTRGTHPAAVLAAGINGRADRLEATDKPPCCPPEASSPCNGCSTTDAATPTAEPLLDVFPGEAPELDPAADFDPADLLPPDRLDPWDSQGDPALWGDDTDADRWELGPDLAEIDQWESTQETGATLSLADLVTKQAEAYRAWPIAAGAMIADCLDGLAARIAYLNARTPADYKARIDTIEDEAAQQHEEIGYQEGLAQARAECARKHGQTPSADFGHPAWED
jgi:hypothetical protein